MRVTSTDTTIVVYRKLRPLFFRKGWCYYTQSAYLVRLVQNAKWKLKSVTWTFKLPYTSWSILSVRSFASSCLRTFISAPLGFHKLYLLSMRCCFEMEAAAVLRMKSNEDRKQVSRLSKKNSIAYRPILCYFEFRKALIQFLSRLDVDSNQI